MYTHKQTIWPGLLLIVIGVLLLINKLTPFYFGWYEIYPIILIGLGILFFISGSRKQDGGSVFPGTIFLLLGAFFVLRNYDLIPHYYLRPTYAYILIILGLAFFAMYLTKPGDWGVLIPAGILLFFGLIVLLKRFDIIYWEIRDIVYDYWPVVLIIIGGGIILGTLKKHEGTGIK